MRALMLMALAATLAGCNGAPIVRGDSEKNFRKSVEEIARRAPKERMEAFDFALRTIVQARAIGSEAERHNHFVSFTDTITGSRGFVSPLQDWQARRPAIVVAKIGRVIDGKTIEDVIEMGAREKAALEARMQEWAARQISTPDIAWAEPVPRRLRVNPADGPLLSQVQITGVQLSNVAARANGRTMLSFVIENQSEQHVRAIALARRSDALAGVVEPDALLHYAMPVSLAPGARRRIITSVELPDAFTRDIALVGMEDSRGHKIGLALTPRRPSPQIPAHAVAVTETPMSDFRTITQ